MHAKDGRLGRVDDGGGQHGAENTAIGNREGATGHFFDAEFSIAGLGAVLGNFFLDVGKAHLVGIAQDRHHQTTRRTHRNTDVKVTVVDDVVAIDRGIEHRVFLQCMDRRFDKEAHEADFDAMLFFKLILEALAHFHHRRHVDLVEGGQYGIGGLRLQQALRDAGTQTAHRHALLRAINRGGSRHCHLRQKCGCSPCWR